MTKLRTIIEVLLSHFPPRKIRTWKTSSVPFLSTVVNPPTNVSPTNDFHSRYKYFPNTVLIFTLMPSTCSEHVFQVKRIRLDGNCKSCQEFSAFKLNSFQLWTRNLYQFYEWLKDIKFVTRKMCFVSFSDLHLLAALETCPMSCLPVNAIKNG